MNVTRFIKNIKQEDVPSLTIRNTVITNYDDGKILHEKINISPVLIRIIVDKLVKWHLAKDKETKNHVMNTIMIGAKHMCHTEIFKKMLNGIYGLDDQSIVNMCKLSMFETVYRAGLVVYVDYRLINPNQNAIENIRIMVNRALAYFNQKEVIALDSTFLGGYTDVITRGGCGIVCKTGIADIEVLSKKCGFKELLQVYVYTLLAYHSFDLEEIADGFNELILFNPKENTSYTFSFNYLSDEDEIYLLEKGRFR